MAKWKQEEPAMRSLLEFPDKLVTMAAKEVRTPQEEGTHGRQKKNRAVFGDRSYEDV